MKDEDEVIEPSEIIIDQNESIIKEDYSHVNPWIRFLARFFDYSLFTILLFILSKYVNMFSYIFDSEQFIPIQFALWVPIEALCLNLFGYTPGKLILRTKVTDKNNKKLTFKTSLRRSLSVWFRGLAMGINIINVIALFFAYSKIKTFKTTSWDRDENSVVTHKKVNKYIILAIAIFVISTLLFKVSQKIV